MKWGLTDSDLQKIRSILFQNGNVEKAKIFGSRVLGNYKEGSDVDLALFGKDLTFTCMTRLSDCFYESDLPYTFDLCLYDELNHLDFIAHINQYGEILFERG
jgi:predicted nucleotidyltransferase